MEGWLDFRLKNFHFLLTNLHGDGRKQIYQDRGKLRENRKSGGKIEGNRGKQRENGGEIEGNRGKVRKSGGEVEENRGKVEGKQRTTKRFEANRRVIYVTFT